MLFNENNIYEIYLKEKNWWTEAELVEISSENKYDFKLKNNEIVHSVTYDEFRLINVLEKIDLNNQTYIIEYKIDNFNVTPCQINEKRGEFFLVTLQNEKKEIITKLARSKQLRQISVIDKNTLNYKNITIEIPEQICQWTKTEEFQEIINHIKEEHQESKIFLTTLTKNKNHYVRIYTDEEQILTIKLMLEVAIQNEIKLLHFDNDKNLNLQKLKNVEQEINKMRKYFISKDLVGLVIGSKGSNINRLKQKHNVNIIVESENHGDNALITILGENQKQVEECYNEIKLVKECLQLKPGADNKIKYNLQEYAQKYNLQKIFITSDKYSENKKIYFISCINLIGSEENVMKATQELEQYLN